MTEHERAHLARDPRALSGAADHAAQRAEIAACARGAPSGRTLDPLEQHAPRLAEPRLDHVERASPIHGSSIGSEQPRPWSARSVHRRDHDDLPRLEPLGPSPRPRARRTRSRWLVRDRELVDRARACRRAAAARDRCAGRGGARSPVPPTTIATSASGTSSPSSRTCDETSTEISPARNRSSSVGALGAADLARDRHDEQLARDRVRGRVVGREDQHARHPRAARAARAAPRACPSGTRAARDTRATPRARRARRRVCACRCARTRATSHPASRAASCA